MHYILIPVVLFSFCGCFFSLSFTFTVFVTALVTAVVSVIVAFCFLSVVYAVGSSSNCN